MLPLVEHYAYWYRGVAYSLPRIIIASNWTKCGLGFSEFTMDVGINDELVHPALKAPTVRAGETSWTCS